MRVAYIFQPPWNPHISGSLQIWNHQVTRRLARHCDVIVYAAMYPSQRRTETHEGVCYRGIPVRSDKWLVSGLESFVRRCHIRRTIFVSSLYFLGYALKVAYDLRAQKCDIVHVHTYPQFVPVIKALNPGARIVLHVHGEWLTQLNPIHITPRLKKADLVLGCSEFVTEKIRHRFPEYARRCHTVFMGVDPEHFCGNSFPSVTRLNDGKRLLFVGRISPEKGLHVLLDALREVVVQYPRAELEIVGPESIMPLDRLIALSDDPKLTELRSFYNGDYRRYLQSQLPSTLATHTTFRGPVPHAETAKYYREADIFVNPSFYESFGMSTVEAMASQLPVVATSVGAVPEVVESGKSGILVKSGDATALAQAILQLLGNQDLRLSMAKAARQRALDLFAWDRICEKLVGLYETLQVDDNRVPGGTPA